MSNNSSSYLLNLLRNTYRMMGARGYDVERFGFISDVENEWIDATFNNINIDWSQNVVKQFIKQNQSKSVRSMMSDYLVKKVHNSDGTITDKYCLIYFANVGITNNTSVTDVDAFLILLTALNNSKNDNTFKDGILITSTPLSPQALQKFNDVGLFNLQHFLDTEIIFDPTSHVYNQQTHILSPFETKKFFDNNPTCKSVQFPRVFTIEPVIKYLGGVVGEIVEYECRTMLQDNLVDVSIEHRLISKNNMKPKNRSRAKK